MNRIEETFKKCQPFLGFVVGGDGGLQYSIDCCLNLVRGGVDILEIGMPFSDPCADGVTIQKASTRALQEGVKASSLLDIAKAIRKESQVPMIFFSYFNPLLQQGLPFLKKLKQAGFDGVLVVDLPAPLEDLTHPFFQALEEAALIPIFLITPSTDDKRLKRIASLAKGFLYYACRKGTTGMKSSMPDDLEDQISRIRKVTHLPIVVGFGISSKSSAKIALESADGFVVGSAFVKSIEESTKPKHLQNLAKNLDPR